VQLHSRNIHVLDPEGEGFADPKSALIEERDKKMVPPILTGIDEPLNLLAGQRSRTPFRSLLLEDGTLGDPRPSDAMQKAFATSALGRWRKRPTGSLLEVVGDLLRSPEIIVEARDDGEDMIDRGRGSDRFGGDGERRGRSLQPADERCEVVKGDGGEIQIGDLEILEIQAERVSVSAKGVARPSDAIEEFEVSNGGGHDQAAVIQNHIAADALIENHFLNSHA
jgi:hypothetical protein